MATSGPGQPDGLTVLIEDGTYLLPRRIVVDGNQVTYKGLNNDRDKVRLLGNGPHGTVANIFSIMGSRIYIQHLSIGEVSNHGVQIHGEADADHIFLQHLRFFNIREQMLKGSFDKNKPDSHTDYCLVEQCVFEFPEGWAYQSYTGGIDIHRGENWVVKDNLFSNIRTRSGKLTEGAIHFWNNSKNVRITGNQIDNCDRGILLGLDNSFHSKALIQNNQIRTVKDTGIYLCNADQIVVRNNKITIASDYPNAIEYRFKGSRDIQIHDNLVNKKIAARNGGQASVYNNTFTIPENKKNGKAAPLSPLKVIKKIEQQIMPAADPGTKAVSGIQVFHRKGQTFVVFDEIVNPFPSENTSYGEFFDKKKIYSHISYNLYRSPTPIASVKGLKPVATVQSFSGINASFYGISTGNQFKNKPVVRYVIKDKDPPLPSGKGLFVFNPLQRGNFFYAVTSVSGTKEKTWISPAINATPVPVSENIDKGIPVLQRVESYPEFNYVKNPRLYFYTRWETSPNTSTPGRPFDYLVGIPPSLKKPAPVGIHMHGWGGNLLTGYAWWNNARHGSILLATTQFPYDWWTGYREDLFGGKNPQARIRPYTTNRIFSFLMYLNQSGPWDIDLNRTFTAGISMGGSGSIMAAIRYPEKIAWARSWVGIHKPDLSPQFKESYESVWGTQGDGRLFENGTPVWRYYDDVAYLRDHPERETGFITFSNGKNDKGIGWRQAVLFYRMLQQTKRPHLFTWGMAGHRERSIMPKNGDERFMPIDIATNLSLPAFTHCSLDDNPGNGDPENGDAEGQVNRWLYWETNDLKDEKQGWEITVGLMTSAPEPSCKVDITPRRLQAFHLTPGQVVHWRNRTSSGEVIDKGQIVVDDNSLATLPQVIIGKDKNRISLYK